MKQSRLDSFLEASANVAIGFVVSLLMFSLAAELFNLRTTASENFLITAFMTITSLLRQYVLRRLFDTRNPGRAIILALRHNHSSHFSRRAD